MTGTAGFAGTLFGNDDVTVAGVVMAVLIGVCTGAPVALMERTIRATIGERASRSSTRIGPRLPTARELLAAPPPESLSTFRGRSPEIRALMDLHGQERRSRERDPQQAAGPVLLRIHGQPGVGKTVLAQELARHLAPEYPDGVISANFGTAGDSRPPAEILKELLLQLGLQESDMPADTTDRAGFLRSVTVGKRILFIFDAARHHDQVLQVLPTEPGCAVVVTSRRDLGPGLNISSSSAPPLEVPSLEDALEILAAVTRTGWETQAEQAIEVVELCGRLPLAIRSAAERVALDGTDLRHVVDLLRPPKTRLGWLEQGGHGVRERLLSEYQRLVPSQQRALCLLTLVESPTFVPWVLRPLLDVRPDEAENIMASLGAAQLLENAKHDQATGVARYGFNPLVRLFAKAMLSEHAVSIAAARNRLEDAYLELVDDVLTEFDEGYVSTRTRHWISANSRAPGRVAALPDFGVRAEYHNLVRLVSAAREQGEAGMSWRIAARLQGCVPERAALRQNLDAFDSAVAAARTDNSALGEVDVCLAKGAFLVALERYSEAIEILTEAGTHAEEVQKAAGTQTGQPDGQAREAAVRRVAAAAVRRARIQRKIAEAYLQMGAYREASVALESAAELAERAASGEEEQLVALLRAETHRVTSPHPTSADILEGRLHDPVYFRAHLGLSEAARRREHWRTSEEHLLTAEQHSSGDARRTAAVCYRLARLYIERWRHEAGDLGVPLPSTPGTNDTAPDPSRTALADLPKMAVRRAAEAAVAFARMGNDIGLARARCQEVRALIIAGHLGEAERLSQDVWQSVMMLDASAGPAWSALLARFARSSGELLLHRGDIGAAWRTLVRAAKLYATNDDWACHAEIWRLLRIVECRYPFPESTALVGLDQTLEDAVTATVRPTLWSGERAPLSSLVPLARDGRTESRSQARAEPSAGEPAVDRTGSPASEGDPWSRRTIAG
ncbi:NB-ARC domain-containing protein [Plantactinospora soyae]|uniref:Tetratricopeptide (TPR) repeat protein n=1 Tax=Plantactinospora soyae TaxID=1544732 RepID=A0A927MA29_9ACTN|nr:NB-ARC domain-containing protein [Plantactinospora soyae]MBE1490719.1 tetratricopeptide (TPR) repeat protein [Plantactinospora soyae]